MRQPERLIDDRTAAEASWNLRAADPAAALGIQVVRVDGVAIPPDHRALAVRAVSGLAVRVLDVAGVDVVQPFLLRDRPGACQRPAGRARQVAHPVVRMEGGEMQWDVGTQLGHDPPAHLP
ncbi:hypothetical protein SDC9_95704 [bioreactor metagenome]|uniref:Uncharacterized protein n=1 Tax=bioreactor metagenome TaxID=1076179 RepID=A0A645A7D7_9ZZZZ